MYCPRCGSNLPGSDSFCFKCGKDINEPRIETEKEPEAYLYVEAANGMTVRIPASKLESWSKAQDEIRAGTYKPDEEFVRRLAAKIKGEPEPQEETPTHEGLEKTTKNFKPERPLSAAQRSAQSFAETYIYRCPNCNVPRQSKDGTCNACGLTYAQAETLVRLKKENEYLQAKRQESKNANRSGKVFLAVILNIAGCLAAFAAFFLIYIALYWIITFIGRIPLLGAIIYWPSDASWVRLVTCISSAVFGGAWLSTVIAKNAKLFSSAIIAIHIFTVVRLLIASAFTFTNLIECAVAIICAAMCSLMTNSKEDSE